MTRIWKWARFSVLTSDQCWRSRVPQCLQYHYEIPLFLAWAQVCRISRRVCQLSKSVVSTVNTVLKSGRDQRLASTTPQRDLPEGCITKYRPRHASVVRAVAIDVCITLFAKARSFCAADTVRGGKAR